MDKLNNWLTLVTNLGVLAGVIFVAMQLQQANQLALRDSRVEILDRSSAIMDEPQFWPLAVKLHSTEPNLSPEEEEMARQLAARQLNFWSSVDVSIDTGILSDEIAQLWAASAKIEVQRLPGLAPYLRERLNPVSFEIDINNPVLTSAFEALTDMKTRQ